jgi:hypothetical protein
MGILCSCAYSQPLQPRPQKKRNRLKIYKKVKEQANKEKKRVSLISQPLQSITTPFLSVDR